MGRGLCHLGLAEAVLACVEINQCAQSPRDDSARRKILISAQFFAVARLAAAGRAAAGPWAAAHGAAGHAVVRPCCFTSSTSLGAAVYVPCGCPLRRGPRPALPSTTLRLGARGSPLGQRRSGCLGRRHQGCPYQSGSPAVRSETRATAGYAPLETVPNPSRQRQRRAPAYAPKNLAASGSPASPSWRCRRPKNGRTRRVIRPYYVLGEVDGCRQKSGGENPI